MGRLEFAAEARLVMRVAFALPVLFFFGSLLSVVENAAALDKNDPRYVQTECARAWNSCWDGCKGKANSCYRGCNDRYEICLKIEIEAAPTDSQPGSGGGKAPTKPLRGTFGGQSVPGAAVKP